MLSTRFGSLAVKIVAVGFAAAVATGGLAAAGSLPAPAQDALAHAAARAGFHLPASEHAFGGEVRLTLGATTTATEPDPDLTPTARSLGHQTTTATGEGRPTSTARDADDRPTATASDDAEGADVVNHGHCVSYAAHISQTLGLAHDQKGRFQSLVARDDTAVSAKVAPGGTPDAACQAAILKAAKAVAAGGGAHDSDDDHGRSGDAHHGKGPNGS